ncbi:protein TIC 55, chloroplastic [Dendrobium catenatum]|uniref:Protein TIC 55, chloroplastic n=1 Tax=Dendrobium catenatum TaxID=906689 RepID=A0A2I0XIR5_9ASPA|nr:protein TIC 55, chloroplastic [Dendrobium catenatum]PKU87813.1 Protein TIC 55, chloroplastic [Dendrobium catenatum]
MSLSLPSSLFLLPLSKALQQSSSICTSRSLPVTHGYRISPVALAKKRTRLKQCQVATVEDIAEDVLLPREAEELKEVEEKYDWREEWYPLYLTAEVPEDAPLGLTVFHKQIVLYRDFNGVLRCYEDRCPHRLAKLSEGQLVDGRIECLYHGWQFEGDGKCVKIPQLPEGAKIPRAACVRTYEVRDSQGVVWVWMSDKNPPNLSKLPWFEHYAKPGFLDTSTIHELPYDHSILLENLMDPAHVPISHDRTDWTAKREDAQPLVMKVKERSIRGFAGQWGRSKNPAFMNSLSFQAPCVLQNNLQIVDKNGVPQYFSALFLCRPAGQGKSMLIVRFGASSRPLLINLIPKWFFHQNACKVFEQDMGFLSSQNEVLMREKVPTKELYLNLKFSDTWVMEYRKWMDRVGSGMPYYIGHETLSMPLEAAVIEQAPVGAAAAVSASMPAKGGVGELYAPNPTNRYYRHVIHCKGCRIVVKRLEILKKVMRLLSLAAITAAILTAERQWKVAILALAVVLLGAAQVFSSIFDLITRNFIREHRRL